MNAPARIAADPIGTFLPHAGQEERALRQRLLKAQAYASSNAVLCQSPRARSLFWMIVDVAGERAFSPAKPEDLKDAADALLRLAMAAATLERLDVADET